MQYSNIEIERLKLDIANSRVNRILTAVLDYMDVIYLKLNFEKWYLLAGEWSHYIDTLEYSESHGDLQAQIYRDQALLRTKDYQYALQNAKQRLHSNIGIDFDPDKLEFPFSIEYIESIRDALWEQLSITNLRETPPFRSHRLSVRRSELRALERNLLQRIPNVAAEYIMRENGPPEWRVYFNWTVDLFPGVDAQLRVSDMTNTVSVRWHGRISNEITSQSEISDEDKVREIYSLASAILHKLDLAIMRYKIDNNLLELEKINYSRNPWDPIRMQLVVQAELRVVDALYNANKEFVTFISLFSDENSIIENLLRGSISEVQSSHV